jgi:predicted dehydrogenase
MSVGSDKVYVIGWGRMGITHTSIINGLYPNKFQFIVVEPKVLPRLITRRTHGYETYSCIEDLDLKDSRVIITTPPSVHKELAKMVVEAGARAAFIEKPFGLYDRRVEPNKIISVGYVLRFSEIVQKLKLFINDEGCKKISLAYTSNTLTRRPKGWRNGVYGGVLNEMGSHLLDLIFYFLGNEEFVICQSELDSVISDVDDVAYVRGFIGDTEFELSLNWVDVSSRKPVWSGRLITEKREVYFDQQSIDAGFKAEAVNYYVRGRDFSKQMNHFIEENTSVRCDSIGANKVHDIIQMIKKNNEVNTR